MGDLWTSDAKHVRDLRDRPLPPRRWPHIVATIVSIAILAAYAVWLLIHATGAPV